MHPIVPEFLDGFVNVGQRAVRESLVRLSEIDSRVPAAAQFLDRADVDHAVVQELVEAGYEKASGDALEAAESLVYALGGDGHKDEATPLRDLLRDATGRIEETAVTTPRYDSR